MALQVTALCGSLRKDSFNRKLLTIAIKRAEELGATVTFFDMKEKELPIFDEDIEAKGYPENVQELKKLVKESQVILFASPEYNGSITPALKNAIDWLSRDGNYLNGKFASIFGASAGKFGTVQAQMHLRHILTKINVFIPPTPQFYLGPVQEAFDAKGNLKDKKTENYLNSLIETTLNLAKHHTPKV